MVRNTKWLVAGLASLAMLGCHEVGPGDEGTQLSEARAEGALAWREDFNAALVDWEFPVGTWSRQTEAGDGVLTQTATEEVYPLAIWKKPGLRDLDLSVRFRPISGKIDASGGLVFRARDALNYYVVRANSLEGNFRLYAVRAGHRVQIASVEVTPPSLGEWHTLRVVAVADHIQAYLDGRLLLEHDDDEFDQGYVGLWTKADAVTAFDDLRVEARSNP
ncbi:MAG: DUF1080 domain-containing protein [Planctomycetes bacterium]|nr:DUF1080 domain-containing protein [Planctomycetota bacterium]